MRDWLKGFGRRAVARGEQRPSLAIDIRRAEAADVTALRAMLMATWHETYDGWLGAETVVDIGARWHSLERLRLETDLRQAAFLLALPASRLLRFRSAGPILGTAFAYRADVDGTMIVASGADAGGRRDREDRGTGERNDEGARESGARGGTEACARDVAFPPAFDHVEIGRLYVARDAQGRGVGRQLLHAVFAAFADSDDFRLDVDPRNTRAIAFYEQHGFVVTASGGDLGGSGLSHLVMQRRGAVALRAAQ